MKQKLLKLLRNAIFRKICYILFILFSCKRIVGFIEGRYPNIGAVGFLLYSVVGLCLFCLLFWGYAIFVFKIVRKVKLISEYIYLTFLFIISYFSFSDLYNYVRIINIAQDNYIQRNLFSENNKNNDYFSERKYFLFKRTSQEFKDSNTRRSHISWPDDFLPGRQCILFNLSSKEVENLDSNTKKYLGEGLVEFVKFSDTLIPFDKALNLIEPWSPFRRDIERAVNFGAYNAESTNDTLLYSLNEYYLDIRFRLQELRQLELFNEVKVMTEVCESNYQRGYNFKIGFFGYGFNKHTLFFLGLNFLFFILKVISIHHILKSFNLFPDLNKYGLISFFMKKKITRKDDILNLGI